MQVYDMIVDERRYIADLLSTLTPDQLRAPSLCEGWTVHDVAAHLITFLRFGQLKIYLGIVATAADLDRVNLWLTQRAARRSSDEIIEVLRRRAGSRVTVPRSGYDPVLTDLVLHDLDIRVPLGISRDVSGERLAVALHHLTSRASPGFTMGSRLDGLRFTATDTGWDHGTGAPVRGPAQTLLLGIGGRPAALDDLSGDGVPLLRQRLVSPQRAGALRRLAGPL
ncbi:MAG: maleylpyruvate isomerase family mycothiol-dependent enzyme, partial [Jatrophihabitantaceae bacterium]